VLVHSLLRVLLDSFGDLQKRLFDLRIWITSGEEISAELAQRFRQIMPEAKLINLYGSSEVSADVSCYEVAEEGLDRCIPIGRPIDNTSIFILDSHLQPVPIGVPGELYIGGVGLARGYLNQPDLTAERFILSPFRQEEVVFKTGDLGRYLPDGNIEFSGRVDHQVKIRGFRIELGEVEAVLKKHPEVEESVVVDREDPPNDKRLVAYLVLRRKPAPASHELHRFLKQSLPDYMLPSAFVFLDALPLTPSGKVDRKALPAPDQTRSEPVEDLAAPRDALELQLTSTWEKVLGVRPIGVRDDFFELGGHSLLAVRLITQIEKILGKNLPLATLFQAPTVEQLAGILREQGWSAPSSTLEETETGSAGSASISSKITRHLSAKSHAHLRQQYRRIKAQPGYQYLKRQYLKAKSSFTKRFLSYPPLQLEDKLKEMGLTDGDSVYMHSAFKAFNGFSGGPQQVIDCILNVIGNSGNLLMLSMPYTGATEDYLKATKVFDVTKTESSMGIITEIFRRKKEVVRSLNPAHPILALGPDAGWIISDHDKTMYSCGKGSPFEKILKFNAKALFFDVPFWTMTFFHFLEDKFKDLSPVKLYDDEPIENTVINSNGAKITVKTYVFSEMARKSRSFRALYCSLRSRNLMKTAKIGNTKLILVNLSDVICCSQDLVYEGIHFYDT
jgi:aminoglycoside N3'-acetyltransferase/acyl carrier protein